MKHVRLSASRAPIYFRCPGAPTLWEKVPEEQSSVFARTGIEVHKNIETMGLKGLDTLDHADPEIKQCAEFYVRHVRTLAEERGAEVQWERRVSLSRLGLPDCGGTSDTTLTAPGYIHVFDYKHGEGVFVDVESADGPNIQLMMYLLGAVVEQAPKGLRLRDYLAREIHTMEISIVQPRTSEEWPNAISADAVRTCKITNLQLIAFAEELMKAVKRTVDEPYSYNIGDWCRFCRAKDLCPAQMQAVTAYAKKAFDSITIGDARKSLETLTPAQLGEVLDNAAKAEDFITALRKYSTALIGTGVSIPGYDLIPTRPTRRWAVEDQVVQDLAIKEGIPLDEIVDSKLISPAKFEKLLRDKSVMKDLAVSVSSGTKLGKTKNKFGAI